jgi:cytochrome c556
MGLTMSKRVGLYVALVGISVAVPVSALLAHDEATATAAQKARDRHYHELGDAFKAVRDQSKAATPDFAVLEKNATIVSEASVDQGKWFAKGTGPESGKTRALAKVWTDPAQFEAAQKLFSDSAPALLAAAKAHDVAAINTAFGTVGKSCKNCHEAFRAPEDKE